MVARFAELFPGIDGATWPAHWATSEGSVGLGGTIDVQSSAGRLLTTSTIFNNQRAILDASKWVGTNGDAISDTLIGASSGQFFMILRSTGNWFAGDDTMANSGLRVLVDHAGGQVLVFADVATVTTQIGSSVTGLTFTAGVTYRNRFRVQGTSILFRYWDITTAEPQTTWTFSGDTGGAVASAGQFQTCFRTTAAATRDLRIDNIILDDLVAPRPLVTSQASKRVSYF